MPSVLTKASKVFLFTGGDDNAIHLTEVTLNPDISTRNISSVLDAHASTITGVLYLGAMHFLSCGIDQAVKVWRLDGEELICLYKCHTGVPDVGGIVEIGEDPAKRRFVIFGTGMEMIALDLMQENGLLR
jgi:WD40 repeat protein